MCPRVLVDRANLYVVILTILPRGCAFVGRCPRASERCKFEQPVLALGPSGHPVAWEEDRRTDPEGNPLRPGR